MSDQVTFYTLNRDAHCPNCGCAGGCRYIEIPESTRKYIDTEANEHIEEFGVTHEYGCDNCSAQWILINGDDMWAT